MGYRGGWYGTTYPRHNVNCFHYLAYPVIYEAQSRGASSA
jgi:hypothetical protein